MEPLLNIFYKDWFGYIGTFFVTGSLFMISVGWIESDELYFFCLNIAGSTTLYLHSYARQVNSLVLLNLVLILINIIGVVRIIV